MFKHDKIWCFWRLIIIHLKARSVKNYKTLVRINPNPGVINNPPNAWGIVKNKLNSFLLDVMQPVFPFTAYIKPVIPVRLRWNSHLKSP
jgi:hypothetical protein